MWLEHLPHVVAFFVLGGRDPPARDIEQREFLSLTRAQDDEGIGGVEGAVEVLVLDPLDGLLELPQGHIQGLAFAH